MKSANQFIAQNHAPEDVDRGRLQSYAASDLWRPAWVDSDHFDIVARTPGEVRPNLEEQMAMLRNLLTNRFQLSFHREPKEMSIYEVRVAKTGTKLKESVVSPDASSEGPPPLVFMISPQVVCLPARNATMGELASVMQRSALDRPVVDKTGLSGRYDFDLEWTPDKTSLVGWGWQEHRTPRNRIFLRQSSSNSV